MTKVKEAASQQDNILNVQTVQIGKHNASFLVPDYNEGQKLSVIDDGVLKHLKDLLPKANGREIVSNFIDRLRDVVNNGKQGSEILIDAVEEAKDFVAFHTSINLIKQYFDPKTTVEREEPFNVVKPAPTAKEMFEEWVDLGNELLTAVGQYGEGYETLKAFQEQVMATYTGGSIRPSEEVISVVENVKPH